MSRERGFDHMVLPGPPRFSARRMCGIYEGAARKSNIGRSRIDIVSILLSGPTFVESRICRQFPGVVERRAGDHTEMAARGETMSEEIDRSRMNRRDLLTGAA